MPPSVPAAQAVLATLLSRLVVATLGNRVVMLVLLVPVLKLGALSR